MRHVDGPDPADTADAANSGIGDLVDVDPDGPGELTDLDAIEDIDAIDDIDANDDIDDIDTIDAIDDIDANDDIDENDDLDENDDIDENEDLDGADRGEILDVAVVGGTSESKAAEPSADADGDDDDLLADEVEASLDVILAERLRGGGDIEVGDEVEDDEEDDDAPNQLATVIPVRRPEEFLCQSCFLLKPPGQLADRDHQLCRDCA